MFPERGVLLFFCHVLGVVFNSELAMLYRQLPPSFVPWAWVVFVRIFSQSAPSTSWVSRFVTWYRLERGNLCIFVVVLCLRFTSACNARESTAFEDAQDGAERAAGSQGESVLTFTK